MNVRSISVSYPVICSNYLEALIERWQLLLQSLSGRGKIASDISRAPSLPVHVQMATCTCDTNISGPRSRMSRLMELPSQLLHSIGASLGVFDYTTPKSQLRCASCAKSSPWLSSPFSPIRSTTQVTASAAGLRQLSAMPTCVMLLFEVEELNITRRLCRRLRDSDALACECTNWPVVL